MWSGFEQFYGAFGPHRAGQVRLPEAQLIGGLFGTLHNPSNHLKNRLKPTFCEV